MSPDEAIPTDASTVQRTAEELSNEQSESAAAADEISHAKTVIRGSSRIEKGKDRLDARSGTPASVAKVLLGKHLNHFLLNEMIGGGGMGAVFRAHDEHLDRTVAIKVIPFVGDDPELQRRFRNEAQSAAKLDHPRIARVYESGSYDDWHYIVFEYIEGTNIRDQVNAHGVMSIDEAVFYTSHLADALQHAADRGIVHRDIKPSNVLIGTGGKVKLVDMGLARSDSIDLSDDMTASGVTLGTFDYISPEQAHDPRVADLRSDIYSLGCTLYFMLTGNPPYPGGTMLQKLLSHGNAPPPDPRELRPDVSDNLVAVIQKMLAKKPIDRYQTATDLIADLREVAFRDGLNRSQSLSPVRITPPNPTLLWLEKHLPWIVAVGLMLASAGWLHLESVATRKDVTIPNSAQRPLLGPAISPISPLPIIEADPPVPVDQAEAVDVAPETSANDSAAITSVVSETERVSTAAPVITSMPFPLPGEDVSIEPLAGETPEVIRVVGDEWRLNGDRDEAGRALAPSLARALEMAAEFGVSNIELAVPMLVSEPVQVEVDDLKISSVVGGTVVVFEASESVTTQRSRMFSIGSHPIEFDGLHFVWKVPIGSIEGGTLFEISDGWVDLLNCSITIDNATLREQIYAFDVPVLDVNPAGVEAKAFPRISVSLKNVIVRGEMTMLHMNQAVELLLSWSNGLLAITDRMIDTAGAVSPPPVSAGPMQISLTRLVAHMPKGLVRMSMDATGPYPVAIDRFARNSVFFIDPDQPHFQFHDKSWAGQLAPLEFRGVSNAYAVDADLADPMLMLVGSDGETQVTRVKDLLTSTPAWANDNSPVWSVTWAAPQLTTASASQRSAADYRQQEGAVAGFDERLLPVIPASH
jgi:eukaryotic-like serine/threonine-protein kinase